jgi:hypothetical protein
MIQKGPFEHISVSPSGDLLALYSQNGKLWVVSSDFQRSILEVETHADSSPIQISWYRLCLFT